MNTYLDPFKSDRTALLSQHVRGTTVGSRVSRMDEFAGKELRQVSLYTSLSDYLLACNVECLACPVRPRIYTISQPPIHLRTLMRYHFRL